MASDFFPAAASAVLSIEGPDSDDPRDPGGLTRFGIALREHPELTRDQLLAMTRDDALAFYRAKYWDAHRCGEMPWRWGLAVFDGEVNQGSVIRDAQAALHVSSDGEVGAATLAAMGTDAGDGYRTFMALRLIGYAASRGAGTYEKGWFARAIRIAQLGEHPPA